MTPAADHIEELALIAMSRLQREVLDRWMVVCADAGEIETAEEIRQLAVTETQEELRRAA
jgi:hypothetical protein